MSEHLTVSDRWSEHLWIVKTFLGRREVPTHLKKSVSELSLLAVTFTNMQILKQVTIIVKRFKLKVIKSY